MILKTKAPPVYKPQQSSNPGVQLKPANNFRIETRPAPPVYRPQQAGASATQQKPQAASVQPQSQYELSPAVWVGNGRQQIRVRVKGSPISIAPPVYRPTLAVKLTLESSPYELIKPIQAKSSPHLSMTVQLMQDPWADLLEFLRQKNYVDKTNFEWLDIAKRLGMDAPSKRDFGHGSKKDKGGSEKANSFMSSYIEDIWYQVTKLDHSLIGIEKRRLAKAKQALNNRDL